MTEDFVGFQSEIDTALADPARRARVEGYAREIDVILALSALRDAIGMTQEDFATELSMSQENVSRIERATDVKMSPSSNPPSTPDRPTVDSLDAADSGHQAVTSNVRSRRG